jgi:WhiB family redox-sensing transcriptional regulator
MNLLIDILDSEKALCTQENPDVFFEEEDVETTLYAKLVCSGCSLVETCIDKAMQIDDTQGVWGGSTTQERLLFRKKPEYKELHIVMLRKYEGEKSVLNIIRK